MTIENGTHYLFSDRPERGRSQFIAETAKFIDARETERFVMTKLILLVAAMILLTSCTTHTRTGANIDNDRAEVVATSVGFWQAYERKDLAALSNMLTASSDFTFFGSDAAEVVKTRRDWEDLMRNDWQLFETIKFAEPKNVAIQVSSDGKLASIVYEVTDISLVEGKTIESLDRFAMTMRKEGKAWHIVQGMTAVATRGESSSEILARRRMKTPKE